MPQLNVAPSPSPVVAPPAPSNAAAEASAPGLGAETAAAPPFAAVLRSQLGRQNAEHAERPKDKEVHDVLAAVQAAQADAANAQPPGDAIAALAQMLAGIVAPTPGRDVAQEALDAAAAKGKKPAADDGAQEPLLLAAANLPAAPAPLAEAPSETAAAETPSAFAAPSLAAGAAENFAADGLENAASHAASTKEEGKDFAALLNVPRDPNAMGTAQAAAHAATPAAADAAHVHTPVGARGWDNEVADKLTWLVNKQETRAELVLNPPQLGRIEVSISMKGDQANASFVSANPIVREALENAVPRLREVLLEAGISLGQAQVGAESFQQSTGNREKGDNSSRSASSDETAQSIADGASSAGGAQTLRRGNGLVDAFA